MIYNTPPQIPPPISVKQDDALSKALGDRTKLNQIKQKMNASYPPPKAPEKKVYSSRPDSVDL